MNKIASVDKPSPNIVTEIIIASGPKNTRAYVEIASASHALGLTIMHQPRQFTYKRFVLIFDLNSLKNN